MQWGRESVNGVLEAVCREATVGEEVGELGGEAWGAQRKTDGKKIELTAEFMAGWWR